MAVLPGSGVYLKPDSWCAGSCMNRATLAWVAITIIGFKLCSNVFQYVARFPVASLGV